MRTSAVLITPELASSMLAGNTGNRSIRKAWVLSLAKLMESGEFKHTHQGICSTADGRIIDGQHRLSAIVLSGIPCTMQLTIVQDNVTFDAIDSGVKRTLSDSTGIDRNVTGIYNLVLSLFSKTRATPTLATAMEKTEFGKIAHELIGVTGTSRRFFSSCPVRLAAIFSIIDGEDKERIFDIYHNLILLEFGRLPPSSFALIRSVENKVVDTSSKIDSFAYAYRSFVVKEETKILRVGESEFLRIIASARKNTDYIIKCAGALKLKEGAA